MFYRGRRLRNNEVTRGLMRETHLHANQLIYPIFVVEGENIKNEISSLKGIYHYSVDRLAEVVKEMQEVGVKACILFGIPEHKDACGSQAYDEHGILQQAIRKIKEIDPSMYVIGDVCMCEYTDHGHCGILDEHGQVLNDATLPYLQKITLSYANSGVDMVAPSAMMDGEIAAMRQILDENGYYDLPIMGYSAKYASAYYGPFREAAHSAPAFGNRSTYQMDVANGQEALREIAADIDEGADIIMVKPALAFLDVIKEAKLNFNMPICAYNVSGEYAMLKMAVEQGLMKESVIEESLLAIKRAGADMIITYFAIDIARKWKDEQNV
ncbi:MAG: porphobilinogen synthase [Longibaculum muris]|uniref:Delta-aminolevulinic acid dehydratase n=1 Tax=Longibaculum muris TaxID=1796628 RepID=A0A4V2W380_9FIRM|nr:porphobilinogen synthase [Longibaculum muris]KXU52288.1 porphobilinogen synthase [Candidatus Stoquefichus sp. KLE1796]MBS5370672.1 porphobilinogen synthase [Coprobacillus cateniformis]MCR1889145.1 porphobilinogen synthase [Longibaculum muris]MED9813291.1 porphobilinogen synthase [Longibaculum muris]TCV90919.1 porphobilinogen synthase [Longibaculum muris]